MEKFKDRKEQREVTEAMNALLLPILNYLNADTTIKVRRALYLLGEIDIEFQEGEKIDCNITKCENCVNHNCCDSEADDFLAEVRVSAESENKE